MRQPAPRPSTGEKQRPRSAAGTRLAQRIVFGAALLGLGALVAAYPSFPQSVWCNLVAPFLDSGTGQTTLLRCSNVRQEILARENLEQTPAEVPGWTVLRPSQTDRPAELIVKIKKDRDQVLFYPRLSGPEAFVEVWEANTATRLTHIAGQTGWNPIGEQHRVCLYCAADGWLQDYDVTLKLVLSGRWTQVWMKDNQIFF